MNANKVDFVKIELFEEKQEGQKLRFNLVQNSIND